MKGLLAITHFQKKTEESNCNVDRVPDRRVKQRGSFHSCQSIVT